MFIEVIDVFVSGKATNVSFSSPFGSAAAFWDGSAPDRGRNYEVELTLDEPFVWGHNIEPARSNVPCIDVLEGAVCITARLVCIEADGIAALDLGGSLVFAEVAGEVAAMPVFVSLRTQALSVCPMGV
ncbi:hypothetical protein [Pseudomonas purpurea]|uniref:hypothetical protein n=1 Tax=Pseudomonas purpurea TaxID=3136737 RepID=UPI003262DFBB